MSVFNAISTAVSGINAQSTAFSNLSNNIANSQTVGYKADSTAFQDFVSGQLINSSRNEGNSDSVAAVTIQHVDKQGTSTISNDSLAMSIQGSGLFNVTKSPSDGSADQTRYFTRNGEFYEDKDGNLVNTSGYYLNGYSVTDQSTGALSNQLSSVNVADIQYVPKSNPTVSVKGYVASSADTADTTQPVTIYDSTNDAHTVNMKWAIDSSATSTNPNLQTWTLTISAADSTNTNSANKDSVVNASGQPAQYTVTFDKTTGAIQSVVDSSDTKKTNLIEKSNSTIPLTFKYTGLDGTTQKSMDFKLNLGSQGSTAGATLASTTSPVVTTPTTDSKSSSQVGSYSGVEIESDGSIMAKFSLGDTQLIGKVALTNFASVNNLQAVSGQAYLATPSAGTAQTGVVGENGTGSLTVGYTESSTTDLTSDLSALIIAQQAYTANTKVVTTASELLQTTIAMKQ